MNRKTITKLIFILLLQGRCLMCMEVTSSADSEFLKPPSAQDSPLIKPAQTIAGQILAIMQVIGVAVAVIMLIVLAIKYMSSAPNDRAEIKKHAVVYVVGAVVLFAASGILGIIKDFAESLGDGASSSYDSAKGTKTYTDGKGRTVKEEYADGSSRTWNYDTGEVTWSDGKGKTQTTYDYTILEEIPAP